MKIKTKKQLSLPQLIEWGFENDMTNKEYVCNEHEAKSVIFNLSGWAEFSDEFSYNPHDTFTVEEEVEITEDTVIDNLYKMDEFYEFYSTEYKTIKDVIRHSVFKVKAVYLNDDLTMTLIWTHEKGLVE